jgi:glycosyltransferase involved in cell wall biosynthesis
MQQSIHPPQITAIICTHNRADSLQKAIQSVLAQSLARDRYEVIVVDNASTDHTADTVRSFATQGVRYVYEQGVGLSIARNTGQREARGEIVAYLDDDAVASPEWLEEILFAFDKYPDIGVVGGPISADWEGTRPDWLVDDLLPYLSVIHWGNATHVLEPHEFLAGANFAFRKSALEMIGGFHPRLDRRGNLLLGEGDVHAVDRIIATGMRVLYHPLVTVVHTIPQRRMTKDFFRERLYWQGVSEAVREKIDHAKLSRKLRRTARSLYEWQRHRSRHAFSDELTALYRLGYMHGAVHPALAERYFSLVHTVSA